MEYLLGHSSHKTQPLDVGLFPPTKEYYSQYIRGFSSFSASAPIQKQRFLTAYAKATEKAFTPLNIRRGFRGAGIWPVDTKAAISNKGGIIDTSAAPLMPSTPKKHKRLEKDQFWYTPKSSREMTV